MQRDPMRDDPRRRHRPDSDPRDMPIERYGNEEDPYSREYRRTYAEDDLPRRLQDDSPYNRPGYEPEVGRPGMRPNVDLYRGRGRQEHPSYGNDWGQRDPEGAGRGRYQGEGAQQPRRGREEYGQQSRAGSDPYGQSAYRALSSPYQDDNAIGPWYGGDTGMGDPGSSLRSTQSRSGAGFRRDDGSLRGGQSDGGEGDPMAGPFVGRGPRGYQRSDERIHEDVCEMLTQHGHIDASQMEVEVRHGVVTLRGTADSGRIRRMVEERVEDVPGVRDVQNELRVTQRTGYADTTTTSGQQTGRAYGQEQGYGGSREYGAAQGDTVTTSGVPAYGIGVAETSGVSTRTGPGEPGVSAGAGRSQHGNPWQVQETMEVVGSDGERVGTVKTIAGTDFILDRPMARDLHVPFSAVRTVDGDRVMLGCRAREVDQQNWATSDLTGSSSGSLGDGERLSGR